MNNKKVLLSVLSAAVVSSIVSPAFAATEAPKAGIYVGGAIDKFYNLQSLLANFSNIKNDLLTHQDQVLYVKADGTAATLKQLVDATTTNDAFHKLSDADFKGIDTNSNNVFTIIGEDGKAAGTIEPKVGDVVTGDLKVDSVSAITSTILPATNIAADYKLQLSYLDKNGNAITADKLPKDLQVTFADDKSVFNADGTVKTSANIPAVGNSILVQAHVTSASQNINITKEFSVKVVEATGYQAVTDATIILNNNVKGSVLSVSDATAKLVPTKAVKNDGTTLDATKDVSPDTVEWGTQVASVESSNETVLAVNFGGTNVNLVPISEGTATVTVTLKSGSKFTKTITVKNAARTATTATAAALSLSSTVASGTVKVKVVDQYGDPVQGAKVYGYPTKIGADAIVKPFTSVETDVNGEVTVTVASATGAKNGSDAVKLSTSTDATAPGIGNLNVNFAQAGDVTSYELRVASGSESTDLNLDTYVATDKKLALEFVGKDANGTVANIYDGSTMGKTYTVSSSNDAVATAEIDSNTGKINVEAKSAGEATITVKQGTITRATTVVKVTNSAPAIGNVALVDNASFTVKASGSYSLSNDLIAKLVKVGTFKLEYNTSNTFDVKDGSNKIGTVEVLASNPIVTINNNTIETGKDFDATTNASLLFRLKDASGSIVNTVALKLAYDGTAPAAPVLKNTSKSVINKENVKAYVVSGTAVAGSTVNITLAEGKQSAGQTVVAKEDGTFTATIDTTDLDDANVVITAAITDEAGNTAKASVDVVKDTTAPTIQSVEYSNGKITITFSEAIQDANALTAAKYALSGEAIDNGQKVSTVSTGDKANDNIVELTLDNALAATGSVTVTVADANTLVDAYENGNTVTVSGKDTDVSQ